MRNYMCIINAIFLLFSMGIGTTTLMGQNIKLANYKGFLSKAENEIYGFREYRN